MDIRQIRDHLPKRPWLLGATAVLALGVAIPFTVLTVNAAPPPTPSPSSTSHATHCDGSVSCLISWGDAKIALRISALNNLSAKVDDR